MVADNQQRNNYSVKNETQINTVSYSQIHTGSGNINISSYDAIFTKNDLLAALHKFLLEIEAARHQGLSGEIFENTMIEVVAAEREANNEQPKSKSIVERLEKAKDVLTAGAGIATAATAIVNQLVPLLDKIIQSVPRLFM